MKTIVYLMAFCFIIYFSIPSIPPLSDTVPASLLPFTIFSGDGLYFDRFMPYASKQYPQLPFVQKFHGHYISNYPLLTGLLSLPVYLPVYWHLPINKRDPQDLYQLSPLVEKLSAAIIASISVAIFYLLIKSLSGRVKISIIFALIFAFATQTFSISSQLLYQHGSANLFLLASQIFLLKGLQKKPKKRTSVFLLSITFGILSSWARINFLIFLFLITSFIAILDKKRFWLYLTYSLLGSSLIFGYNYYFFQYPFGGQFGSYSSPNIANFWSGFLGLLFSPARGMIFYTPLLIFGFISLGFIRKFQKKDQKEKLLFNLNLIYFFAGIFLNCLWVIWWGGWGWGDRLLTDIACPGIILAYFIYTNISGRFFISLFYSLVTYSVIIQFLGLLIAPYTHWDYSPNYIDNNLQRLWSISDNPISRSILIMAPKSKS